MKKLFTLLTLVLVAVSCFATDYTGDFTMDGNTSTKTIAVNKQDDGKYTVILKDFSYKIMGKDLELGDITVTDIDGETTDGKTHLTTTNNEVSVSVPFWGKQKANITLNGDIVNNKFTATIEIYVVMLKTTMNATFDGTDPTSTGITNLPVNNDNEKVELYNLSGQRISEAKPGQVVIEKRGGKAVKVVK